MKDNVIYFDNAATTFPKPREVLSAMRDCAENWCGNAGRASHSIALRSAEAIYDARENAASFFGSKAENVIFTLNTTYALNMAIKGNMRSGGHMLISDMEHNSTLRPVARLAAERRISYDVFPTHKNGEPLSTAEIISGIISRLRPDTRLISAIHTSNVCSYTLPIREIGALCHRYGLVFCVDGAQGAGHSDINMIRDNIDVLCLPGHKGLYAPQGVGMMILGNGINPQTLIEGGNGVNSRELSMGSILPEKYEGGTLCTPAIEGLSKGIDFLRSVGTSSISAHEKALWQKTFSGLSEISGIKIYECGFSGGVLLFSLDGVSSDDLGEALSKRGFCLRTGYHCAPLAHKTLCTDEGGALRVSFSVFNTEREVEMLVDAVYEISREEK